MKKSLDLWGDRGEVPADDQNFAASSTFCPPEGDHRFYVFADGEMKTIGDTSVGALRSLENLRKMGIVSRFPDAVIACQRTPADAERIIMEISAGDLPGSAQFSDQVGLIRKTTGINLNDLLK